MPGDSGVTVVTNACVFYTTHAAAGRTGRPAFPAPSDFRRRTLMAKLARNARRDREAVLDVIARSEATKLSILQICRVLDCFASLAMTAKARSPDGAQRNPGP